MSNDILHRLPGSPFHIWEAPEGNRAPRFAVAEPVAGRRALARTRGTARTLEEATELAASLQPSTPAEILAHITPWDDHDRAELAKLITLGTPGAKLWAICDGYGYEAVSAGLAASYTEAIFGDDNELSCWLIRWHAPNGEEVKGTYVVPLEDAERAWWILSPAGRVIAGGPPIFSHDRALEIAAELGGEVVRGTASLPGSRVA